MEEKHILALLASVKCISKPNLVARASSNYQLAQKARAEGRISREIESTIILAKTAAALSEQGISVPGVDFYRTAVDAYERVARICTECNFQKAQRECFSHIDRIPKPASIQNPRLGTQPHPKNYQVTAKYFSRQRLGGLPRLTG